jgi:hypothetical protein
MNDVQIGPELAARLVRDGHDARWVQAIDAAPAPGKRRVVDVVVVDGEDEGMDVSVLGATWRDEEHVPILVVLASSPEVRLAAERAQAVVVPKPITPAHLVADIVRIAAAPPRVPAPSVGLALHTLGLAGGGLAEDEAAAIVAGVERVDIQVVREALRPHIFAYVTATPLLDRLVERRVLDTDTFKIVQHLDGSRTVKWIIDSGTLPAEDLARLVWALVSGAAAELSPEPSSVTARGRRTATARDHLRARPVHVKAKAATHFQVLEVEADVSADEIAAAARSLSARFSPAALQGLDLGDVEDLAAPAWEPIAKAVHVLSDARLRAAYHATLTFLDGVEAHRARHTAEVEAEAMFARGQVRLGAGNIFAAVSDFAMAARRRPENPVFVAWAAWARVIAEEQRGGDRAAAADREYRVSAAAQVGRRPHARALLAIGLMAEAAGNHFAAAEHLREAVACDPRLGPARIALDRVLAALQPEDA